MTFIWSISFCISRRFSLICFHAVQLICSWILYICFGNKLLPVKVFLFLLNTFSGVNFFVLMFAHFSCFFYFFLFPFFFTYFFFYYLCPLTSFFFFFFNTFWKREDLMSMFCSSLYFNIFSPLFAKLPFCEQHLVGLCVFF